MPMLLAGTFGLAWLNVAAYRKAWGFGNLSRRGALVLAFVGFEALVLVITEVSSVGHHFTRGVVATLWGVALVVLAATAVPPLRRRAATIRATGGWSSRVRARVGALSIEDRVWLAVLAVIFALVAYLGLRYLPSNSDSLVYHLARIEHWVQNRTVAPFATHYLPQIEFAPLAEYTQAQLHLLGGSDRLDAVVALLAAAVAVVGASEVARMLGARRSVQISAAVVCATIPSLVLLASSTENDVFAAAVGMGLLIVILSQSGGAGWPARAATLGVTAGLAYMTKATIPFMLLPAAVVLLALALFRRRAAVRRPPAPRRAVAWAAMTVIGLLVVAGPFVIQETELFGSPVGPTSSAASSAPLTLEAGTANVIRNLSNNFHVGNGHSGWEYELSRTALPVLHRAFDALHVAQHDDRYSVTPAYTTFGVTDYSSSDTNEASGADPLMILLILASSVVLVVAVARGARTLRTALALALGLGLGYLSFTFTAKWGLWDVRYDIVLLVAWSPLIALALSRVSVWLTRVVLIILVVTCLPQLVDNATRPLIPSATFDTVSQGNYLAPYFVACCSGDVAVDAAAYATVSSALAESTCRDAALENWLVFEYPLWVGLDHNHWAGTLADDDVANQSTKLESPVRPCARISQEGMHYITPDDGSANLQLAGLALSVDADRASTIRTPVPRFTSAAEGTRVFAGGGWSLEGLGQDPLLLGHGSLYVTSTVARRTRLVLHLPPGVPQPRVTLTGPDGTPIPSTVGRRAIRSIVDVRPGANRIDLSLSPGPRTSRLILVLEAVSVAPARR